MTYTIDLPLRVGHINLNGAIQLYQWILTNKHSLQSITNVWL